MAKAISLFEARSFVLASECTPRAQVRVPLDEAFGRHLAVDIAATGPWPAADRSAMDGFALAAGEQGLAAGTELSVTGESLAGRPYGGAVSAGQAIRIMTGAVVPPGVDTVVPVEQTSGFGTARVTFHEPVRAGRNIRPEGSEVAAGQRVMIAGQRIGAAEVGALAVLGHAEVAVQQKVRVAIVATGDEVVPIEAAPEPHQLRESNSWALAAQVASCGAEALRLGIAADDVAPLRSMLARGLAEADVLVTIGGISKGTHDLVQTTLAELGVETRFHGVSLKPGKPSFFGTRAAARGARFVFGLPGNPASCFTVFDLLVQPLLQKMVGAEPGEWRARLAPTGAPWRVNSRCQVVPVRLAGGADGSLVAEVVRTTPSGNPFGLIGTQCYGLLPPGQDRDDIATITVVSASAGVTLP